LGGDVSRESVPGLLGEPPDGRALRVDDGVMKLSLRRSSKVREARSDSGCGRDRDKPRLAGDDLDFDAGLAG
jgi:hypothetical protein